MTDSARFAVKRAILSDTTPRNKSKKSVPSSPVVGTNASNQLQSADQSALSENLSVADFRQACNALAQCAAALTALTSAIGKGAFAPTLQNPALSEPSGVPVIEAVNEFLRAKARAGRSDRYLRALRVSLGSFSRGRAQLALSDVTLADLESWLDGQHWSPRTMHGYLSDVRTLFNFCVRRGLASQNPANGVELPVCEGKLPAVHSPGQVRHALEFARSYDANLCRCLALRYFGGLRSVECDRSSEANVTPGHIEITAANAKQTRKRQRRLVTIQPALAAWLALGGTVNFGDKGNRFRLFKRALLARHGVHWPDNVTRHTFVSYHLASFRNAALTALEAGHTEQMLFSNYRELTTMDGKLITSGLAAEFWGILPS